MLRFLSNILLTAVAIGALAIPLRAASCSNTDLSNGWTCIVSVSARGAGFTAPTTAAVTTSGADILIAVCAPYGGGACGLSDSKSNTWTACGAEQINTPAASRLYYATSPMVGTNHTFSSSVAGTFIAVAALSGGSASSPCDQTNGANGAVVATLATGSITPAVNGSLIVVGASANIDAIVPTTANNSLTVYENLNPILGETLGGALALKSQTTAAAINVTLTFANTATNATANIADFKSGTASAGGQGRMLLLGVGR